MEDKRLTEYVTFRLSKDQLASAKAIADKEDRRLSDVVRRIFLRGLALAGRKR